MVGQVLKMKIYSMKFIRQSTYPGLTIKWLGKYYNVIITTYISPNTSQDENVEDISSEELTPTISCNALAGINTPQTLNIEGYIKNKKVIVLIDSSSTHNFVHYKLSKSLNCFIYPAPEFQVIISNGGTIDCSRKIHKINITMGEYVMNSPMISIPMGGVDLVLVFQWLQSLGTIDFNF
jgi:hypothetical protein